MNQKSIIAILAVVVVVLLGVTVYFVIISQDSQPSAVAIPKTMQQIENVVVGTPQPPALPEN